MTTRRDVLKWIPPVVMAVTLPAHAQTTGIPEVPEVGPPTPLPPSPVICGNDIVIDGEVIDVDCDQLPPTTPRLGN